MKPFVVSIPLGGFNRSGGVKTLVLLANAMAARGWQIRIIVPDYAAQTPFYLDASVSLEQLGTSALPLTIRKIIYYVRLAVEAAKGADLCLANYYLTAYCALVSKALNWKARIVYFVQGDEAVSHGRLAQANWLSRLLRSSLAKVSYRLPVSVICVSYWLKARIGRPDGVVVTQGLDLDTFRPSPRRLSVASPVVIGTVGSLAEGKGYQHFCRAVTLLPDRSGLEVLVAANEEVAMPSGVVGKRVSPRNEAEMAEFYNHCDIFVFASLSEGFGLPPLEAMACGCAVVTTKCGGVTDFSKHETNCLMVSPGDPEELAEAIERLLHDRNLCRRLADEGINTGRQFDRTRMVAQFLDVLAA